MTSKKKLNAQIEQMRRTIAELKAFDPRNVGSPYIKTRIYKVPEGATSIVVPYMVNPWTGEQAPAPEGCIE